MKLWVLTVLKSLAWLSILCTAAVFFFQVVWYCATEHSCIRFLSITLQSSATLRLVYEHQLNSVFLESIPHPKKCYNYKRNRTKWERTENLCENILFWVKLCIFHFWLKEIVLKLPPVESSHSQEWCTGDRLEVWKEELKENCNCNDI